MDSLSASMRNLRLSDDDYADSRSGDEPTLADIDDVEEFFADMPRSMSLRELDDYLSELFEDYGLSKTKIRKIIKSRGTSLYRTPSFVAKF